MNKLALSLGATSDEVQALQAKLQDCGLPIPMPELAGNYFGLGTHRAVFLFQREHSLPVTGVYDRQTAAVLEAATSKGSVAAQPERETVCCGKAGSLEPPPRKPDVGEMMANPGTQLWNKLCPWSGKPVRQDAVLAYKNRVVGFCSVEHRDQFKSALEHFEKQKTVPLEDRTCPWSGAPVDRNATMAHDGQIVGFCSTGHRDRFKAAVDYFSMAMPDYDGGDVKLFKRLDAPHGGG